MIRRVASRLCTLLAVSVGATASAETARINSPGETHQVVVSIDDAGSVQYRATYRGKPILLPSRLGLKLESTADLSSGFVFTERARRHHRGRIESRLAERSSVDFEWNELALTLGQKATGRSLRLTFRVFDEGLAFRYEIPQQSKLRCYAISGELTELAFSAESTAYTEYGHEGEYFENPIDSIREGCELPLLVRDTAHGLYHVVLQADAWDYSRRFVRSVGPGGVLGITLKDKVAAEGAFVTPWIVVSSATSPGRLIEQNYIRDALVDKPQPEPSWIVPGKAIRVLDLTTAGGKEGVDFAAANGLQYVEFDAGWYGGERDPKENAATPRPGLDVEEVCRYGRSKGIGVVLYVNKIHLRSQLERILATYKKWGVKGLKFGFVDGRTRGGIDEVHRWTQEALRHEMIVDVHDNYRPTGISQRLPNLLTQEGIRGNEWMPTTRHNTTMPFTRLVAGAADYTICYRVGRARGTNGHQLALSVVVFSPLQFMYWYGHPQDHTSSMGREWFKIVPTTWDQTRVLSGEVGEHYAVARRRGSDWFLGAITSNSERTVELHLGFLDPDTAYRAKVFRDGEEKELEIEQLDVTAETTLKERLRANGGVSIVLRPSP